MKNNKYGEKIRKFRNEFGYTQEYMGECLGMSANNYGYIENGKISIDVPTLENIVKIFNISLIDFFESDDPKYKIKQTNKDQATGNLNVNPTENSIWQEVIKAKDETINILKSSLEKFNKS